MTRFRADLLLLLAAAIWGSAFVAQKWANATMGPIAFVSARFLLSAVVIAPLAAYEARKATAPMSAKDVRLAVLIGVCLLAGSSLQQAGLVSASATNGGFLTALYVVAIPFTTWIVSRDRIRPLVFAACIVSVAGAWLLTDTGVARTFARGDLLLVAADIPWALSITFVAVFMRRSPRPFFLSLVQYSITAIGGAVLSAIFEPNTIAGIVAAGPAILYAGIISGGIAFTAQIIAQSHTPPSEAGLIMSLESVFAAVAGVIFLSESLTFTAMIGCALILAGVIMVETGPALHRNIKALLGMTR